MSNTLTELKYRTFDSLLEDVRVDLRGYALSGRIEPQQLIKVALRVSKDLGLRINMTKYAVLEIEHKKHRLPDDFYVMNYAMLCGEFTVQQILPQGTHIEDVMPKYTTFPENPATCTDPVPLACNPTHLSKADIGATPLCLTQCGKGYQLIQTINSETRTYKYMLPLRFTTPKFLDCDCPNLSLICRDEAYIESNFIHTSFDCGNVYICYQGSLTDDEGNILVLDHPIINEYYEYAIKHRILENIFLDGDTTATNALQEITAQLRAARNNALTIVNTPDFNDMLNTWKVNRRAFYHRYYQMFES